MQKASLAVRLLCLLGMWCGRFLKTNCWKYDNALFAVCRVLAVHNVVLGWIGINFLSSPRHLERRIVTAKFVFGHAFHHRQGGSRTRIFVLVLPHTL